VLGSHVAGGAGIDGLAIGTAIAAVVGAAPLWHWSSPALDGGWTLVASLLAVGVLSNAVPYGLDQIVMARVGMARFSVLLAILPATAAVIGAVVLSQRPTALEVLGIALVVVAVALNERGRDQPIVEPVG
jgi:inner membrane transporter RhtA